MNARRHHNRCPVIARRIWLLSIAAALATAFSTGCSTKPDDPQAAFPNRPIKLIVPFSAGGGTDTFARIIKKAVDDNGLLPQPMVIINQPGAGATIGSRRVKDAEPDGYTMLVLHDALITAKYSGTVAYGPEAFDPICATGEVGLVIAVREDSPYQSLNDLMRAVQQRPEQVAYAANMGAVVHFAAMHLEQLAPGAKFRFVQSGGGADRFADLTGGHVEVTGFSIEEFVRFRRDGLRGLAFFGRERHPGAPDVPTAIEQGFALSTDNVFFWWFPKGVSKAKIDVIADALERAMQTPYVRQRLAESHIRPIYLRGKELRRQIEQRTTQLAAVDIREPEDLPDFPFWIGLALTASGLAAVASSLRRWSRDLAEFRTRQAAGGKRSEFLVAAASVAVTFVYVFLVSSQWFSFRTATIGFVFVIGMTLSRGRWRSGPSLAVLALALGFGCDYVFTEFFTIDLP